MHALRLIFFDMEGTLFRKAIRLSETQVAPSSWVAIAQHLGKEAYEEEMATQRRWLNREYSGYIAWMEDTIRIHKKFGLTREIFEKILNSTDFIPGVHDVFDRIHRNGVRTSLITGGFKFQADRAARKLGISHVFAGCEYFWDDRNKLSHWNLLPADFNGKVRFMESLAADYNCERAELAFVGDGKNDVNLAQNVGTSIAFNAANELQKVSTYSIIQEPEKEDFRAVLPYLGLCNADERKDTRTV